MKRRHFVLAALAVPTALAVGWAALPPRQRLQTGVPLATAPGPLAFNGWVKIGTDGSITIAMPRSEMGQGAHTGLAMLLADELDADWTRVRVEASPIDAIYFNQATVVDARPFHPDDDGTPKRVAGRLAGKAMRELGLMVTGGSTSIKDLWLPMREAGASARAMLVGAAGRCTTASAVWWRRWPRCRWGPTRRSACTASAARWTAARRSTPT